MVRLGSIIWPPWGSRVEDNNTIVPEGKLVVGVGLSAKVSPVMVQEAGEVKK